MCTNCTNNTPHYYSFQLSNCTNCSSTNNVNTSDITYTGPALNNILVDTNSDLATILSNINTAVGAAVETNWADFDYACLAPITSAQEFAEGISTYVCNLNTAFTTFQSGTYSTAIAGLQSSIDDINEQGLTSCAFVGIVPADELHVVLTKLISASCTLFNSSNPSAANWNQCYTVSPLPTNITDAFNIVIDWVCDLKTSVGNIPVLPVFDNTGTCLPSPTSSDTLSQTIIKLRTLICELPEFDIDDLTWSSCIANPNPGGGADLISTLNTILTYLNLVNNYKVTTFDSDYFVTTGGPCSGYEVSLQPDLGFTDRLVALNVGDTSPGTLLDKMIEGDNISFDTSTTPGSVIINSTAVDNKVKANAGDASNGYLIDKIAGKTDGSAALSINQTYNSSTDTVDLTPSIDYALLAAGVLQAIGANPSLNGTFCGLSCNCDCGNIEGRQVYFVINNNEVSLPVNIAFKGAQANPTLTYVDIPSLTINAGTSFNSGAYTPTSTDVALSGQIIITNNNGTILSYTISVVDELDNPVPSATSNSGTIGASGGSVVYSPFIYGDSTKYYVTIDLQYSPVTTSTTTSTSTTLA